MATVTLRRYKLSDAKKLYTILNNPQFIYFSVKPKSIAAEKEYLKKSKVKWKDNLTKDFAILYNGNLVGGIGLKIDQHRPYIGEVGYFIDELFWKNGIATKAVALVEEKAKALGISRITLLTDPRNKASIRVAQKSGFKKEGTMKKAVKDIHDKAKDVYLFAKIIKE